MLDDALVNELRKLECDVGQAERRLKTAKRRARSTLSRSGWLCDLHIRRSRPRRGAEGRQHRRGDIAGFGRRSSFTGRFSPEDGRKALSVRRLMVGCCAAAQQGPISGKVLSLFKSPVHRRRRRRITAPSACYAVGQGASTRPCGAPLVT